MPSDRLSVLDAAFLHLESPSSPLHFGALAICDGPPPAREELIALIEERLERVPRYRRRLAHSPLDHGRPRWVDDGTFRIEAHVHHAALPAPGGRAELHGLVARVFAAPLDRRRALWELWLIEALADGSFALLFKTHHALVDGLAGVEVAARGPRRRGAPRPRRAAHAGDHGLLARTLRDGAEGAHAAVALAREAASLARRPARPRPARARRCRASPRSPASSRRRRRRPRCARPGPAARSRPSHCELADLSRPDATVNDVLLAAIAGALRRFLHAREIRTDGLELRALVPVALRAPGSAGGELGNRVAGVRATLPVGLADPQARLDAVRGGMAAAKGSPPGARRARADARSAASRRRRCSRRSAARTSRRGCSTCSVTNVPGPREELLLLGRRMREILPIPPLPRGHALSIAMLSYDGHADLGLLADAAALPELERPRGVDLARSSSRCGRPARPRAARRRTPAAARRGTSTGTAASSSASKSSRSSE